MKKIAWVKTSGRVSRTHYVTEDGTTKCGRDIPQDLEHLDKDELGPMCARCEPDAEARTDPEEIPRRRPRRRKKKTAERKSVWGYTYEELDDVDFDLDKLCPSCSFGVEYKGRAWLCNTCSGLGVVDKIEVSDKKELIFYKKKYYDDAKDSQ